MNLRGALLQSSNTAHHSRLKLSTGLTLLNLALSGESRYGIESGSVVWLAGESDSGRTSLGLTILAEACVNRQFKDFGIIYDDAEGQRIDIATYFGKKVSSRIQRVSSKSNLEFWASVEKRENPFVCFLDSLDGLGSGEAWRINNAKARAIFELIRRQNSVLIMSAQEKKAGAKSVSGGGFAVQFFADYCLRTMNVGSLARRVAGKERAIGTNTVIAIKKGTRGIHKIVRIPAPIIQMSGYSDTESMFLFLLEKQHIVEDCGIYKFPELGLNGRFGPFYKAFSDCSRIVQFWLSEHFEEFL